MSTSKMWTNWAVKLHTATAQAAAAVHVDGVQDASLTSNLVTGLETGDGAVFPTFSYLQSGGPVARFSSMDLKTILDEVGADGHMLVDDDGTHPGVVLYWQRISQGGTRVAVGTAQHVSSSIANGIMVLRTLRLSHGEVGSIDCEVFGSYDGTTAPVVFNETDTLAAGIDPAIGAGWTLGKVDLNATQITGLESVEIDFGIEVGQDRRDSDIYPSFVYVVRAQPIITIRGVHVDATATLTEDGAYYTASQVTVYARERAEGGTFTADVTAQHLKFTLGKCRVDWDTADGDPKMLNFTIRPYDTPGGVAPLAVDTASAIT